MKKLNLAALALACVLFASFAAFAADIPSRKAPPLPPQMLRPLTSWSGFYLGVNAGALVSQDRFAAILAAPTSINLSNAGFIGGGQIGFAHQLGALVVGVEADFNGSTAKASNWTAGVDKSLGWIGTARGRLGWLVTPSLLVYGTGGLAYGHTEVAASPAAFLATFRDGQMRAGWAAGAGAEWMFAPDWSAKVEYLYFDLGRQATSFGLPSAMPLAATRFDGHVARAGLNYHFDLLR